MNTENNLEESNRSKKQKAPRGILAPHFEYIKARIGEGVPLARIRQNLGENNGIQIADASFFAWCVRHGLITPKAYKPRTPKPEPKPGIDAGTLELLENYLKREQKRIDEFIAKNGKSSRTDNSEKVYKAMLLLIESARN